MKTIKLTNSEIESLVLAIENGNTCSSGCAYSDMTTSRKSCEECRYTKDVHNILIKLGEI